MRRIPGLSGGIIPKAFIPDKVNRQDFEAGRVRSNANGTGVYQDSGMESSENEKRPEIRPPAGWTPRIFVGQKPRGPVEVSNLFSLPAEEEAAGAALKGP